MMRKIEPTTQFKRDYKREKKGKYKGILETIFTDILELLANDEPLPEKHRDHALANNWHDHRDCHIKPDLVLIYRRPDDTTLQLVRLGSHSELSF